MAGNPWFPLQDRASCSCFVRLCVSEGRFVTSGPNGDISDFALATNLSGTVEGLRVTSNGKGIFVAVGIVRGNTAQQFCRD
jgi:hypothetical protein